MNGPPPDAELKASVRRGCARTLVLHRTPAPAEWLAQLARSDYARLDTDVYGEGGAVGVLEARVASLLGKPAAAFFTKGVAAQLAALRVWAPRHGARVALHPLSHLDLDEDDAPAAVNGAAPIRLGTDAPFTVADLEGLDTPPDVVAFELPLRRAGFLVPEWEALAAVSAWSRGRTIPLHLDGARLWEVAPAYGRQLPEIAGLADSVYVSLYKGLGAPSGAMLAGSSAFVAEAKRWRLRLGAQPYRNFPVAIGALEGLDRHLPAIARYWARARALAAALAGAGMATYPAEPMCNGFRVRFAAPPEALEAAHVELAQASGVWWFNVFRADGAGAYAEIMVGDGADDLSDAEVVQAALTLQRIAGARAG